jgi:hypothetical protein
MKKFQKQSEIPVEITFELDNTEIIVDVFPNRVLKTSGVAKTIEAFVKIEETLGTLSEMKQNGTITEEQLKKFAKQYEDEYTELSVKFVEDHGKPIKNIDFDEVTRTTTLDLINQFTNGNVKIQSIIGEWTSGDLSELLAFMKELANEETKKRSKP